MFGRITIMLGICLQFSWLSAQPVQVAMDSVSSLPGLQVVVPVRVAQFTDMITGQGSISWDTAIASFDSVLQFGLPGMGAANFGTTLAASGTLTFSWNDNLLQGVTVPDSSVIFALKMDLTGLPGTSTTLRFSNLPTALEFTDTGFSPLPFDTVPGFIQLMDTTVNAQLKEKMPQFKASLYPNPANNEIFLLLESGQSSEISVDVYNGSGRIVNRERFLIVEGSNNLALNSLMGMPAGLYTVKLRLGQDLQTLKLILQNSK